MTLPIDRTLALFLRVFYPLPFRKTWRGLDQLLLRATWEVSQPSVSLGHEL